jgi:hypothetical protein
MMLLGMCQSAEKETCSESSHRASRVTGDVSVAGGEPEHRTDGFIVRVLVLKPVGAYVHRDLSLGRGVACPTVNTVLPAGQLQAASTFLRQSQAFAIAWQP